MTSAEQQVKLIKPHSGWRLIDFAEMWRYRDLFYFLVARNVKVLYKQTVLGFGWSIIRPLVSMVIFTVIFGKLAAIRSDGIPYPLFSFAALVPWTYFSTAMTQSTDSVAGSVGLISKVYFPRVLIPLTPVLSALVDFSIAFGMLGILMVIYGVAPTWYVFSLPVLVLLMMLTASGIGMWLSATAVQFRDIRYAMSFVAQVLMYAAPVVWPVSLITEKLPVHGQSVRLIYGLYPMAGVIEGFRSALFGRTSMPWDLIGMGTITAIVLFITGALYFRRMERVFADVA